MSGSYCSISYYLSINLFSITYLFNQLNRKPTVSPTDFLSFKNPKRFLDVPLWYLHVQICVFETWQKIFIWKVRIEKTQFQLNSSTNINWQSGPLYLDWTVYLTSLVFLSVVLMSTRHMSKLPRLLLYSSCSVIYRFKL